MALPIRRFSGFIVAAVLAFLALLSVGAEFYTDLLWFSNLGYASVFWTLTLSRWVIYIIVGVIFLVFLYVNLSLTKPVVGQTLNQIRYFPQIAQFLTSKRVSWFFLLLSLFLAVTGSTASGAYWETAQNFLNRVSVGLVDPLFSRDIGFYLFDLPFYNLVYRLGMSLLLLSLVTVGFIYFLFGSFGVENFRVIIKGRARYHLAALGAGALLLKAWGYRLSMYGLVYSPRSVVFGGGYTDVHVLVPGLKVLFWLALLTSALLIVAAIIRKSRYMVASAFLLLAGSVLVGNAYPALVQQFIVEPNELAKESQYITYNINATLEGYGLKDLEERTFELQPELTYEQMLNAENTIDNIRLWDYRPLLSSYGQLQEMRLYYDFLEVDIDRYYIDGRLRQVSVAPREMVPTSLSAQARTWINQHLKYTHGYGVVASPVNEVSREGMPTFWVKDIPPVSIHPELEVSQPAIYYGEAEDNYVIVNTVNGEFDYPLGDQNAYAHYAGQGGVPLNNLVAKAAFAFRFSTLKLFLSNEITPESRLMFNRNIRERAQRIAPFLTYDRDPYIVIDQGRLFWILDAYVTSSRYPYSEPFQQSANYIRNSIKVVIDAYNGTVDYYIVDENEPLAQVYSGIFPELFKPVSEMPTGLQAHLRYPEDLFEIQSRVLAQYHMTDPTVFYNKEDLWNIPTEIFNSDEVEMEPYYLITELDPGEENFILIRPFTPVRKNNMVAWLAAKSDFGPDFGQLVLYKFPKQALTYGPMQVEARIDQDSEISRQLTLWNSRGSSVIRGNLLVIPLKGTMLYVEPLYLRSEQSELPELKRVIVAYGNEVVMATTLDEALRLVGGVGQGEVPSPQAPEPTRPDLDLIPSDLSGQVSEIVRLFNQAQDALAAGNWTSYGELMSQLQQLISDLETSVGE